MISTACHAFGQQRVEPGQRARDELFLAGGPRCLDARQDAAAGPRDLLVGGTLKPHLEFVPRGCRPKTRWVWQSMRPGVIEPAAAIERPVGVAPGRQVAIGTHEDDTAVTGRDGAVLDQPEPGARRIQRRDPGVSP